MNSTANLYSKMPSTKGSVRPDDMIRANTDDTFNPFRPTNELSTLETDVRGQ